MDLCDISQLISRSQHEAFPKPIRSQQLTNTKAPFEYVKPS